MSMLPQHTTIGTAAGQQVSKGNVGGDEEQKKKVA